MRDLSFNLDSNNYLTLQGQIRNFLIEAILTGQLPIMAKLPSTRALAKQLKISRNTVTLAYQSLETDGVLISLPQKGYYVSDNPLAIEKTAHDYKSQEASNKIAEEKPKEKINWQDRLNAISPYDAPINKPENWRDYPYPFLYGQADMNLFPFSAWRNCMRQAMTRKWTEKWTDDLLANDDSELVKQVAERILLARGVHVKADQILITLGAQNAIFIATYLLTKPSSVLAMEDPGYTDVRHLFQWLSQSTEYGRVKFFPLADYGTDDGLAIDRLGKASLLYVTPSHQVPTGVTMSMECRKKLLEWADEKDAIIIEDDYDFEINHQQPALPALKSIDHSGRVLYVGSFSKSVMPGLRLGFLVGSPEFIVEAKKLKRLCLRHAPGNNQRALAVFLGLGHYNVHHQNLKRHYIKRSVVMGDALNHHFADLFKQGWAMRAHQGGMSYWLTMPENIDSRLLASACMEEGVLIEPGGNFFQDTHRNHHHMRLGFSSIDAGAIDAGIQRISHLMKQKIN